MSPSLSQLEILLTLAIAVYIAILLDFIPRRPKKLPLPPSPKSDPIIGHLRYLPTSEQDNVYARWSEELKSDIISLSLPGQTIIILNSAKAAYELLEQRSSIYSDRSELPVISQPSLMDWSKNTALIRYGERWRSQRRMTHTWFHKKASVQFWPTIVKQSRLALQRLLTSPDNFSDELRRMSGSAILSIVYGYEVTSANDPLVEIVELAMKHLSEASAPGNFFVNTMPWLRYFPDWFPGTSWKRKVKKWSTEKDDMYNVPFIWTKEQIANGTASPSMLSGLLSDLDSKPSKVHDIAEEADRIKWVTGTMFAGGSDTSAATTVVFVLAMVLNPAIQAKAQAEIDAVIGGDRLPEMEDRHSLPYIECVLKEVLRWQPVVPLGLPHASMDDDDYKGYRIPKGASVIGNIRAISNDPSVYPSPGQFNPGRFLDPTVPSAPVFGFGRRSCPGVHMAESTLFITVSSMLAVFDIRPARDEQGREIIPVVDMKPNVLVSHPADFKCSIKPRSGKSAQLLNTSLLNVW